MKILKLLCCFILLVQTAAISQTLFMSRSERAFAQDESEIVEGEYVIRSGFVEIPRSSPDQVAFSSDTLMFDLFNDVGMVAVRDRSMEPSQSSWIGHFIEGASGYVHLFFFGELLAGNLYTDSKSYNITFQGNSMVRIDEVDTDLIPDERGGEGCECSRCHSNDSHNDLIEEMHDVDLNLEIARDESHPVIDILIVYPTSVVNALGGASATDAEVNFRIEEANTIFQNSRMNLRFRLVHHQVFNAIPQDATSASNDVRSAEGILALRNKYGADLVAHWNFNGSAGSGNVYSGRDNAAYSTSRLSNIRSIYTFVHEAGHNLGAHHCRQSLIDQDRDNMISDDRYYYGHLLKGSSGNTFRTVMAYNSCESFGIGGSCTRIPRFSNPRITYQSAPLGINPPHQWAADNARRIDETAPIVANFRKSIFRDSVYLTTDIKGQGRLAISPEQPGYTVGTTVELTATPDVQWVFTGWRGAVNDTANPISVTMSTNQSLSAFFTQQMPSGLQKFEIVWADASAEQNEEHLKGYSFDGNLQTRWANDNTAENNWIYFDIGRSEIINAIRVQLNNGETRSYPLMIEIAEDTASFSELWKGTLSPNIGLHTIVVQPDTGRYIRFSMTAQNSDENSWFSIINTEVWGQVVKGPFSGVRVLPGIIQAQEYDVGGEGVSYHDSDSQNIGFVNNNVDFRVNEGVDIDLHPDSGYVVGWTRAGEWLEYTVDVTETEKYEIEFHASSLNGGGLIGIDVDGEPLLSSVEVPQTEDWSRFTTFTERVTLHAGEQIWRINIEEGGFNLDKIAVAISQTTASLPVTKRLVSGPAVKAVRGGFVVTAATSSAQVEVFSLQGKRVLNKNGSFKNSFIDLRANGVYLVRLWDGEKVINRKIVIQD